MESNIDPIQRIEKEMERFKEDIASLENVIQGVMQKTDELSRKISILSQPGFLSNVVSSVKCHLSAFSNVMLWNYKYYLGNDEIEEKFDFDQLKTKYAILFFKQDDEKCGGDVICSLGFNDIDTAIEEFFSISNANEMDLMVLDLPSNNVILVDKLGCKDFFRFSAGRNSNTKISRCMENESDSIYPKILGRKYKNFDTLKPNDFRIFMNNPGHLTPMKTDHVELKDPFASAETESDDNSSFVKLEHPIEKSNVTVETTTPQPLTE